MQAAEKKRSLLQRFAQYGLHAQTSYSAFNIGQTLDKIIGRQFDAEILQQIEEQCSMQYDNTVRLEEFVDIMIQAEQILTRKVQTAQVSLQDYTEQMNRCMQQLAEAKRSPVNQYGIVQSSTLTVDILQARNIPAQNNYNARGLVVLLECGNERQQQTQPSAPQSATEHVWNQTFMFPIYTGQEDLLIKLVEYAPNNSLPNVIGNCAIKVSSLVNQAKIQNWAKLFDQRNKETAMEIEIGLLWIHNKVQYYEDLIGRINEQRQNLEQDVMDYDRDLAFIQEALGLTTQRVQFARTGGGPSGGAYAQQLQSPGVFGAGPSLAQSRESNKEEVIGPEGTRKPPEEVDHFFICGIVILALSFLTILVKPSLLDIVISMLIILIIWLDCYEVKYIQYIGALTAGSLLLDLIWVIAYGGHLFGNDKDYVGFAQNLSTLYRFCVIAVWLVILTKGVFFFFAYKVYQLIQEHPNEVYFYRFFNETIIFGRHKRNIVHEADNTLFLPKYAESLQSQGQRKDAQWSQSQQKNINKNSFSGDGKFSAQPGYNSGLKY